MTNNLLKIATVTACLFAAHPVQAAGFSAAFGPLRSLAVNTTGSIANVPGAETVCISAGGSDLARADLALFSAGLAPTWDI